MPVPLITESAAAIDRGRLARAGCARANHERGSAPRTSFGAICRVRFR